MTRAGQKLTKTINIDLKADYTEMIIFINNDYFYYCGGILLICFNPFGGLVH